MIPILMYHALEANPSPISITPETFAAQVEWLHAHGWQTVTFGEIVDRLRRQQPLPPQAVCLTFDDGFAGIYEHAFPILHRHNFTATVFLVAGFCGQDNGWPGQPEGIPILPLLDWVQIGEMAAYGIEFGAHTMSHPRLDLLPVERLQEEVVQAKEVLENQLQRPITVFAYPYGRFSPQVHALVSQTYTGACTIRPGRAAPDQDLWQLPRADAYYLQSPLFYKQLANPLLFAYLQLRGVARTAVSTLLRRAW